MIASAADTQMLAATIHNSPTGTIEQATPLRANLKLAAVTVVSCFLGHCLYSFAACRSSLHQIAAFWLCLELAFFTWTCWR